jgi:hypothetical protein
MIIRRLLNLEPDVQLLSRTHQCEDATRIVHECFDFLLALTEMTALALDVASCSF